MKPHLKESFAAIDIDLIGGVQNLIGFDYDYQLAPRVWLGWSGCDGLGVRGRYWQYDHSGNPISLTSSAVNVVSAQSVTVIFPGVITSVDPGEVLTVNNSLAVETIDLEATQQMKLGRAKATFGGGLRYAKLQQTFDAVITDGGVLEQQLSSFRQFEGFGPMLSADFQRPVGTGGFSAVGGVAGSVMFGQKTMRRFLNDNAGAFPPVIQMDQVDEVTGVGELRLGVKWERRTQFGDLSIQGQYEGQLWTDAGAPTLTFLGFEGLNVAIGLRR